MPHVLVQYPVYMQRVVVVPSARIFLAERQEDPFMRKILTPCELLSLGVDPSTSDKPDKNSDDSFSGN